MFDLRCRCLVAPSPISVSSSACSSVARGKRRATRAPRPAVLRRLCAALPAAMALLLPAVGRAQVTYTGATSTLVAGSSSPYQIAVSPDGTHLYVSNNANMVSVIDATTDTLVTNITVADTKSETTRCGDQPGRNIRVRRLRSDDFGRARHDVGDRYGDEYRERDGHRRRWIRQAWR